MINFHFSFFLECLLRVGAFSWIVNRSLVGLWRPLVRQMWDGTWGGDHAVGVHESARVVG